MVPKVNFVCMVGTHSEKKKNWKDFDVSDAASVVIDNSKQGC